MYRPENWERVRDCENPWGSEYPTRKKAWEETFDAGADAYGEWLTSREHQDWLATPEGEACNGRWVFIPDDTLNDMEVKKDGS